jgi:acetyl-CoA acetyltransferase
MSALLAGLPYQVPATTVNRLCGSSLDAIAMAARAIKAGEANLIIAGGVESMSRAPYVMGKSDSAFGRSQKLKTPPWVGVLSIQTERNVWCRHHATDCGERGRTI